MFTKKNTVVPTQNVVAQPKKGLFSKFRKQKADTLAVPGVAAEHSSLFYQNVQKPTLFQKAKLAIGKWKSPKQTVPTQKALFSGKQIA